ncbi:hypothetical protein VE01_00479 [Pseudogymnoascus verrucosus]|uniref:Zn(2)-C6 fungal-type domain-containing protein n=1 Tax=Pseudogymnoascus verrucosus TaxID=342668 RepID=A0A2P2SY83_9PEZI|nr:uncharacterized protein VE01_00479 [Pseudogymnoascus verrucosus]OBU01787.1 hypothetical protein VE01_00479 [Pseudogymnoascus verrucosus]
MDPFSQASLSPGDYYHGGLSPQAPGSSAAMPGGVKLELPPAAQAPTTMQQPGPGPGPRNYKSRKYRPCDFCRARQVACKIEVAPPCQLCQSHRRECTFVEQPKKKRRPPAESVVAPVVAAASSSQGSGSRAATGTPAEGSRVHIEPPQLPMLGQDSDISGHLHPNYVAHFDERLFERQIGHDHFLDHQQHQHQQHHEHHQGLDHTAAASFQMPHLDVPSPERSLDSHPSRSARLVGETGETNPYLLRRYHYDDNDECTISQTHYRRIRPRPSASNHPTPKDAPPPVFTLAADSASLSAEPRTEDHVLAQARYDISQLFTSEQCFRLLGLYFRFVDPYLPILARASLFVNGLISRAALDALPLSLTATLYATALPYTPYDALLAPSLAHAPDPSTQLYRTAHLALTHELHNPRPATLQAVLLLLHRPAQHTPFRPALVATAVSLAHSLGLSHDSTSWSLPAPDLALRKRLWHAVFITDKWTALTLGTPSCIRTDDADVPPLWPADLEPALGPDDGSDAPTNFRLLADLSSIVADILDSYFSVRATQRTASNFALSLDLGRGLRARLDAWSEGLPRALFVRGAPVRRGGGDAGLYLGYLVANMTLFRGLMRPLEGGGAGQEMGMGSGGAVRAGARECAEEAVVFVEGLAGAGGVEGFWHSWSRANFAIASAFLTQLLLTASTEAEGAEMSNLVARWRWAMRMGAEGNDNGGGLMGMGLGVGFAGLGLDGGGEGGYEE